MIRTGMVESVFLDTASADIWNEEGGSILKNDTAHFTSFHVRILKP
jgi:hypothetical protein